MTAVVITLRERLRPGFCAALAWGAVLAGAALVLAPAALLRGAWPPLHARCVGVMLVSLAVALASARRVLDPAALRMPLVASAAWSLSSAALALATAGALWPWALAVAGGAALVFARIESDPPAPAQHADTAWRAWALLALLAALGLLAGSQRVAAHWPWRLTPMLVSQYGPLFLAWGVAAWMVSRERRRYVRAPVLWGLLTWAWGVLAVSLWHAAAFKWANPLAWLWFAGFAALGLLAGHRLWPAWPHRLRKALGLQPHDNGTGPPRQ
jgi:hypothetical protein